MVYRIHKNKNYTVMSNTHLRDKDLSLKARGLLSTMLSLPDDWDYSMNGLVAICKENITAIKSALNELKAQGYLSVTQKMPNETESGKIEYVYDIYETPQDIEKQDIEKQDIENLPLENLSVENPIQLNTNKQNTNKQNTNKQNTNKQNTNKYIYSQVIDYLNEKAQKKYRITKTTTQHINARLKEGFTIEDFEKVIDKKCNDWLGTEFEQYLRPTTIFGTKFESYLNAPVREKKTYGKSGIEIKANDNDILEGIL